MSLRTIKKFLSTEEKYAHSSKRDIIVCSFSQNGTPKTLFLFTGVKPVNLECFRENIRIA